MLWYKAWLECRFRFILSVLLLIWFGVGSLTLALRPSGRATSTVFGIASTRPAPQQFLVVSILTIGLPLSALILAGSGINAQTNWGLAQGIHPSTQFTLSLPVTRARLLWTRAGLGWLLLAAVGLVSLVFLHFLTGGDVSVGLLPAAMLGSTGLYAIALWLSTFLDELWSGFISLTLAGLLAGYSTAGGPGWINSFGYLQGKAVSWQTVVFYLALSALLAWASWFNVRRKQY